MLPHPFFVLEFLEFNFTSIPIILRVRNIWNLQITRKIFCRKHFSKIMYFDEKSEKYVILFYLAVIQSSRERHKEKKYLIFVDELI